MDQSSADTFTIIACCMRTGMLGVAMATRDLAVGSRCPHAMASIGAVATQANTDPRLGYTGLRLLQLGFSATKVLEELAGSDPYIEGRQLAVIDRNGLAAARTGAKNRAWAGHIIGPGYVAMGNALLGEHVNVAIQKSFLENEHEDLEERMMRAIEAGRDAGGQHGGQRSAAMKVYDREEFPRVDLRVDEHTEPVAEMRRLLEKYKPLIPYFNARAQNPNIPTFDVWLQEQGKAPV